MSIYDPPSDPHYCAHECGNCDHPLTRGYGDWYCTNPQCERGTGFKGDDPSFVWCQICEDWINKSEFVRWTGDDALHHLCPGCDSDMTAPQPLDY